MAFIYIYLFCTYMYTVYVYVFFSIYVNVCSFCHFASVLCTQFSMYVFICIFNLLPCVCLSDTHVLYTSLLSVSSFLALPPHTHHLYPLSLLFCSLLFSFSTVPNSGLVLWFQQFCAMFLKRFYNTLRFWQAIITQLLLPLLFVLFALILAVTLPNANENDPLRSLSVENSGLDASNRILFYAEFGADPNSVFDFEVSSLCFPLP